MGCNALSSITTGQNNTAIGFYALSCNTAIGSQALFNNTGWNNTEEGQLGTFPSELLPKGDPGPPGEGFFSGSLLFLPHGVSAPSGYSLLGKTEFLMQQPNKKIVKLVIRIYQKD